jgi:hypothetical protein
MYFEPTIVVSRNTADNFQIQPLCLHGRVSSNLDLGKLNATRRASSSHSLQGTNSWASTNPHINTMSRQKDVDHTWLDKKQNSYGISAHQA